ncbi:MAG: hypothetical protein PHQ03_00390 [Methylococcales bacterium]|nr:hypothetical protein [Methylococcales bacterium]
MFDKLNMQLVKKHYDARFRCHEHLLDLLSTARKEDYLEIALGIGEFSYGNFSANEHHLGERILSHSPHERLFELAQSFMNDTSPLKMLKSIYVDFNLPYLKIGVGSEMAMMLKPNTFWVANVRTLWTHLLLKHNYDLDKANEELSLYRTQDDGEMRYEVWREIYPKMKKSIDKTCEQGNNAALTQSVTPPNSCHYMWFDVIASSLYETFAI